MSEGRPRISVQLQTFAEGERGDWRVLLEHARAMDDAGVDRLLVSDHVVFGENLEAYGDPKLGGMDGGRQPTGPDGQWLEPLAVLSAIAAVTARVRLGTGILLAALRRPVVLAKTAATIDVLSGGRLDLGVGVGWQREEYEAAGLTFERRGRALDHTLEVCEVLWSERRASYTSDELSFSGVHQMPKPVQEGGVPIWVSGTVNRAVARRLVRFGKRWIPWGDAMVDPFTGIARMREAIESGGADPAGLHVLAPASLVRRDDRSLDLARTMETVPRLVEAGVTDVRLFVPLPPDHAQATELLAEVVGAFRSVTA